MKKFVRKITTEFEKRFSKNGKFQKGLKDLKNLQKKYPKNEMLSRWVKIYKQKIYGIRGGDFLYEKMAVFFETHFPFQDGILNIEGVKFDLSSPSTRYIFYIELVDILCCDDHFRKSDNNNNWFYQMLSGFPSEGPYQYGDVFLETGDVVIDAGANIGMFSLFANHFHDCKCYAFEPVKSTIKLLERNIALSQMEESINIVPYALNDKECDLDIQIDNNSSLRSSFVGEIEAESIRSEKIHCVTLDQWAKENDIQKIDFIKADIEGAERYMLLGATDVLKTFAPKLSICTYHLPDDPQVLETIILNANPNYKIEHGAKKLYARVP